jgi:hypothetical protein
MREQKTCPALSKLLRGLLDMRRRRWMLHASHFGFGVLDDASVRFHLEVLTVHPNAEFYMSILQSSRAVLLLLKSSSSHHSKLSTLQVILRSLGETFPWKFEACVWLFHDHDALTALTFLITLYTPIGYPRNRENPVSVGNLFPSWIEGKSCPGYFHMHHIFRTGRLR